MEDIDLSSLKVQKLPDEKTTDQNEPKKKSSNGVGKEKNADKNDAKKTQLCIVCSSEAPHACARCQLVRYCGKTCQQKHWPDHKKSCFPSKNTFEENIKKIVASEQQKAEEAKKKAEEESHPCANCKATAKTKCSNCHQVHYCQRSCQKEHWSVHKKECHPFKFTETQVCDSTSRTSILQDPRLARYVVASRPIKAGEVILKEEPLVLAPFDNPNFVCLGCYKTVDGSIRCSACGWPVCGKACEASKDHQAECGLSRHAKPFVAQLEPRDMSAVLPLRCLALYNNEEKLGKLLAFENHREERKKNPYKSELQTHTIDLLKKLKISVPKKVGKIDSIDSFVEHALGSYDVNGMTVHLNNNSEGEVEGLFPLAAMMEHSCQPNVRIKFSNSRSVVVKAAVDIPVDGHLSISYSKILNGTTARQKHLLEHKYFLCSCVRCSDPTEFGTNLSAVKCLKCPKGYCLPIDTQLIDSKWACSDCKKTMSAVEVEKITDALSLDVKEALKNPDQDKLTSLLKLNVDKVVHPNHYSLIMVRHTLMQLYSIGAESIKEEKLSLKEKVCTDLMDLFSKLDPNAARVGPYLGVVLYEYQQILVTRATKASAAKFSDESKVHKYFSYAKMLLKKCIGVLQDEPDNTAEGKLRYIAQKRLTEIGLLVKDEDPTKPQKPHYCL